MVLELRAGEHYDSKLMESRVSFMEAIASVGFVILNDLARPYFSPQQLLLLDEPV